MSFTAASLFIPLVLAAVSFIFICGRKDYFSEFIEGAKEGLSVTISLLPPLIALVTAITLLNASGAVDFLCNLLSPAASFLGVPKELLPLVLTRPFSGSASTAILFDLYEKYGADSFAGLCASVLCASSDTLVYIISVYFASVGVRHTRSAFPAAFLTMLFSVFLSCLLCSLFFA